MLRNVLFACILVTWLPLKTTSLNSVWRWECDSGYCQKREITPETEATAVSLAACRLFCSKSAALWPKPTGEVSVGNYLAKINVNSIDVLGAKSETKSFKVIGEAIKIFKDHINSYPTKQSGGKSLEVHLNIEDPNIVKLALETDESYSLTVSETSDGRLNGTISANNYFGARHGLETLSQLIIFDDLRDEQYVPRDISITDKPAYPYRGILLDTARNYVDVKTIKKTLDGMGASKLNRFHWHITDTHSFPYVAQSNPNFSKYGAYSPKKIYTPEDVADLVAYALARGVAIIPEFDAPAHVGEGWQHTDFVVCLNKKPWQDYCVEPPCGQFDPTKTNLYDTLEGLYGDMIAQFDPDIFHMGGDEVNFNCWNTTDSIVEWMSNQGWGRGEADFVKLWDSFQSQAYDRLQTKVAKQIPTIMWTSHLTEIQYIADYLPKDKYIIQIWTTGTDQQIKDLLNAGYNLILSNYDALYLDCGFGGWVTDGNNWCSPYIGWQKVYGNTPKKIAGSQSKQILGSEATLWSEQADSSTIDSRLWPRAAAMAEVLWSEPEENTWRDAEARFLVQRERLVEKGINADALEPEWCLQNEESCPTNGDFNKMEDEPDNDNSANLNLPLFLLFFVASFINLTI